MDFFRSIFQALRRLFSNLFDRVKPSAIIAVKVVDAIKRVVESETLQLIVDLTPTQLDNRVLTTIKKLLPIISSRLVIAHKITLLSDQEAIDALLLHLRSLDAEGRKAFWVALAAEFTEALSSEKLSFNQAVLISQLVFSELRKK